MTTPAGTICHRYDVGASLYNHCSDCDHLVVLHARERGCAGCEAIAQAIATARAVITELLEQAKEVRRG
jgi:ribosomal protein L34E